MTDPVLLLLAEDEALIRLNLKKELAGAGFALVVASSGRQALAEVEADASRFRARLRLSGDRKSRFSVAVAGGLARQVSCSLR